MPDAAQSSAERILAELKKAHRTVYAAFNRYGSAHGLTMPQMQVLSQLAQVGKPVGLGELARRLGLAKSTVSAEVDRLVKAGYVERRTDPRCRRCVLLGLAPEGRRLGLEAPSYVVAQLARELAALPPESQAVIEAGLCKLNQLLERLLADAPEEREETQR